MRYFCLNGSLKSSENSSVISNLLRKGWDEIFLPDYNSNTHYLSWSNEDNYWNVLPIAPPEFITPRQMRLRLFALNKVIEVTNYINSISDLTERKKAQIDWEYATAININNPLVDSICSILNLNKEEEFIAASLL